MAIIYAKVPIGPGVLKMAKKLYFFLFLVFIFIPRGYCQSEVNNVSQYLYEYGRQLYEEGDIDDAVHELKKALLANPDNCLAHELLVKISPQPILTAQVLNPKKNICPGEEIIFQAQPPAYYDNQEFTYIWDFGDGRIVRAGPRVSHAYAKGGDYLVNLTLGGIASARCADSAQIPVHINLPPVVKIDAQLSCCVNREFIFDGSASYDPEGGELVYHWDFGDGRVDSGKSVRHRYVQPGKYNVRLLVFDQSGPTCNSSWGSSLISVEEKPQAVMQVKPVSGGEKP